MWQKFLYSCFLVIVFSMFSQAYAQTLEVSALSDFSTLNPPDSIQVKLLEPLEVSESLTLPSGVILSGDLIDVVSPRRLKRNASFSFKLKSYKDAYGKIHDVNSYIVAKYTTPLDKGDLAKSAALGVGSFFVKGLSVGVAAVKGAAKNEEGNRLKSSAVSVYESSPFSYAEKGQDLVISVNQSFYLKFPDVDKKPKSEQNDI